MAKKGKNNGTATIKHKLVLKYMSQGYPRMTAMIKAGYSESYARSSTVITSKTWKDITAEYFDDEEVALIHRQQLQAKVPKSMPFYHKISDEEIKEIIEAQGFTWFAVKRFMNQAYVYFTVPDTMAIDKALDKIYKIKNRYGDTTIVHKYSELTDEDIERETAEILAEAQGIADGEAETDWK